MAGDAHSTAPDNTAPEHPARPDAPPAPLALYRRYRPATFAEVKGQEHVTEPLRQALRNGRVHHAYLFSGPRGCGKTSSARILARSLNCEQGPTPDPCGVCASCEALAPTGPGSIDVIEIDAASHGGVDDARDLRERAFYAPVAGRFKIYIIDEAHMVTREGFNALLKLVEEPPPHLKFVFATTEPEKVIPTIRSRTHHYPFRLVPPAVLRELLEEILAAEGNRYEPAVLPLVVRAGAGSVRDSLSVLDQLLAGAGEEGLTYDRTIALLGYSDDSLLDSMVDAFATGDGAAVFATIDKVVEGGHDSRRFAADLLDRCRDLIILAAVPSAGQTGLLEVPADRLERMTEQAGRLGQAELTRAAGIISEGLIQMRGTTSPRLLLELMCAQILLPGASTGEKALLARVERLERRLEAAGGQAASGIRNDAAAEPPTHPRRAPSDGQETGPATHPRRPRSDGQETGPARRPQPAQEPRPAHGTAPEPAPPARLRGPAPARPAAQPGQPAASPARPAAPPSSAATVDAETVRQHWAAILDAVLRQSRVAWMQLSNATVHTLEDGVLVIGFAREGEAKGFTARGSDQEMATALAEVLGVKLRVRALAGIPAAGRPGHHTAPAAAAGGAGPAPAEADAPAGTPAQPGAPAGPGQDAARPATGGRKAGGARRGRSGSPPPPQAAPPPEDYWPDEPAGPEDSLPAPEGLTGMDLITRQLGGQIIEEIDGD